MRKLILLLFLSIICPIIKAHTYCGDHRFDGIHKNEVEGTLHYGYNTITGRFLGPTGKYTHHFTDRWSVAGAVDLPFYKHRYGVYAKGIYRLPLYKYNFYFSGKFMYNRYSEARTNEYVGNLSLCWEASYFDITVGTSRITYSLLGSTYMEPPTFTFGAGLNIRPRNYDWNIGLYFRNYDSFYYENWNINWGVRWYANLPKRMKLFGELNVRPAGSMSQLATKYEFGIKTGLKYTW